jgi:Family of unknown function (DUF5994)
VSITASRRREDTPTRLTLASDLGEPVDGAWWPYSGSVAKELPELIEALAGPLGDVVDITINWSSLEGVPNLDSLHSRGSAVTVPGRIVRPQRVMTVTGRNATVRLLVIPSRTSTALAVMLLRRAARLPVFASHMETDAFRAADAIVTLACTECSAETAPAVGSA